MLIATTELNVDRVSPRLLALRPPFQQCPHPLSLSFFLPYAHAHHHTPPFRSIRRAPIRENSRRSLARAILRRSTFRAPVLSGSIHPEPTHPPLGYPISTRSSRFRRLKPLSCAHPPEDRPCPGSTRLFSFPFTPLAWARGTFFVRGSFTWLNNDREKDRTFRLKEYRHAAIVRLLRRQP
ncbi:unnamed protein product [Xylocopa violacea]|uniref:Uncharacterized protein n=1 Tax=Xylocopa violacea TaxID=135666 RepID=A0ABP1N9G2_XYLVO